MEAIIGLKELNIKLDKLMDKSSTKKAMTKSVLKIERDAKTLCPVDTGALRRSIASQVEENAYGQVEGIVYSPLEYAQWVHNRTGLFAMNGDGRKDVPWSYQDEQGNWHSTSGKKPNPFMDKAVLQNEENIRNYFEEQIKEDIK